MKLRKRIAALGAAMTMAVSMMSIGASAFSGNICLHQVKGAPSSACVMSQSWNFITSRTKTTLHISSYSSSSNGAFVLLSTSNCAGALRGTGTVEKSNVPIGIYASANASFKDYGYGNYSANGYVNG